MGRLEVVQDKNDDSNMEDDVFQLSELVELYQVALLIGLEENSNFCFFDNIFIYVDVENLNVVLSCNEQAQVNEDYDSIDINVEDYDGTDDESLKKKEEEILTNYQKIKV